MIRRREFLAALLGGAAAWPVAARGQQSAMPVVGFLNGNSPEVGAPLLVAFRQGLAEGDGVGEQTYGRHRRRHSPGSTGRQDSHVHV